MRNIGTPQSLVFGYENMWTKVGSKCGPKLVLNMDQSWSEMWTKVGPKCNRTTSRESEVPKKKWWDNNVRGYWKADIVWLSLSNNSSLTFLLIYSLIFWIPRIFLLSNIFYFLHSSDIWESLCILLLLDCQNSYINT